MVSKRGCVGWLQKRTNLEKTLLSLSSLLLLTLFLMIVVGVAFHGNKSGDSMEESGICWEDDCIKAAGDVLSSMQSTSDSCTDFYSFACGHYGQEPGQTAPVPRRSSESVYFLLKNTLESEDVPDVPGLHDVKIFYNSCVEFGSYHQKVEETGASLLNVMSDVGVGIWPIIDSLYDTTKFSLESTLVSLALLDVPVVFSMDIVPDEHLDDAYLIEISPGGPQESGRSPSDIRNDDHLRSSVLTSLLLLGASTTAGTDVKDILSVDGSFAAIEQERSTPCDDVMLLAPDEVTSELDRLIPEIEWKDVLSEIRKMTGLRSPFAVKLRCKQKIRDYVVHLDDLSVRSETNYLGWRFFSKFMDHVIPTVEKSHLETGEVVPRWRQCLELMEQFASPVLADVLTRKMISSDMKEKVERITQSTLSAVQHLVSSASWLNDSQKSRIREKVSRIRIRYPFQEQDAKNGAALHVPQVDVSNFTAVVIRRQREWMIEKFQRLDQAKFSDAPEPSWAPVLSARMDSPVRESMAYVYFDQITSSYVRLHGSEWMHLGGLGVSFAREISKVLLSTNPGRSDKEGLKVWKVWLHSKNSSACLNSPLSTWLGSREEDSEPQEVENLLRDIFLDQSSLEIAYQAALSLDSSDSLPNIELSGEQMFFLGYAQTLCNAETSPKTSGNIPEKDRVNAVLVHFQTFNTVFGCDTSSPQCRIWA